MTGSEIIILTAGISNVSALLTKKAYSDPEHNVTLELQKGISNRFKNIEYSKTAGICTFLDPRFKLHPFSSQTAKDSVKEEITTLVIQQYNKDKNTEQTDLQNEPPEKRKKEDANKLSVWGFFYDSRVLLFFQSRPMMRNSPDDDPGVGVKPRLT